MMNLLSQTASQGIRAGYVTLIGSLAALVLMASAAVFGLTTVLTTIPSAYLAMKLAGATYLLYLAIRTIVGGLDFSNLRDVAQASPITTFSRGFLTNALNPKLALLYVALLPPFIDPHKGHVILQTACLASVQIAVSGTINAMVIASAGTLVAIVRKDPNLARALRLVFASALGFFAVRLATDRR